MTPLFMIGAALLIAVLVMIRVLVRIDPDQLAEALRIGSMVGAVALGIVIILLLIDAGGWFSALALIGVAIPLLLNGRSVARHFKPQGPQRSRRSTVTTEFLCMILDHNSNDLSGTITRGQFSGRRLDDLSQVQLLELLEECREDGRSASLLEAFLDRTQAETWRQQQAEARARAAAEAEARRQGNRMTADEAWEILGLTPGASPEQIREAHRRLMHRVHPDLGGTDYFATKLNQARELLLRGS